MNELHLKYAPAVHETKLPHTVYRSGKLWIGYGIEGYLTLVFDEETFGNNDQLTELVARLLNIPLHHKTKTIEVRVVDYPVR